jgi:hypothetical protein
MGKPNLDQQLTSFNNYMHVHIYIQGDSKKLSYLVGTI